MKTMILATALLAAPALAEACPQFEARGAYLELDGFSAAAALPVFAGGEVDLRRCYIHKAREAVGRVTAAPSFEVQYEPAEGHALSLWIESACDTVLLINSGRGEWRFADGGGPGENAMITLTEPAAGLYDVWVGSRDGATCDAELRIATHGGSGS